MNGLPALAQNLASQGRYGDSVLVHMSPEEVGGLQALAQQQGTDLTINPVTGMPEAFKLKKLFRRLAPILPFVIPGVGTALAAMGAKAGLNALASKAIASGVIGGIAAPGKGFNFKEGLKTGIMAYAGGKLAEGLQAAGQPQTGPSMSSTVTDPSRLAIDTAAGQTDLASLTADPYSAGQLTPTMELSQVPSTAASMSPAAPSLTETPTMAGVQEAGRGVSNIVTGAPGASAAFTEAVGVAPTTAAVIGTTGYGLMEADKERQVYKEQMAALQREEDERLRRYRELFGRTLGSVPMAAGGGLVALAKGGMPTFEYGGTTAPTGEPRMVRGAGDGMSDNVPANIEGVQEARLAHDEFVVPADVVSDIGNGSSNAGAKKLYAMMDRVRKARHGTTKQPPEIEAEKYLPA